MSSLHYMPQPKWRFCWITFGDYETTQHRDQESPKVQPGQTSEMWVVWDNLSVVVM